jgi:hypothetical protein
MSAQLDSRRTTQNAGLYKYFEYKYFEYLYSNSTHDKPTLYSTQLIVIREDPGFGRVLTQCEGTGVERVESQSI